MFEWWWEFLYSISHAINQCLDALYKLFLFFAGASDADINMELTGTATSNPINSIFSTRTVAIWFAGFLGIAMLVFLISFIIAIVRTEYVSNDNREGKVKIFKSCMKGTLLVILMPAIFGIGIRAVTILLTGISAAMSMNENNSFAQELMDICMPNTGDSYPWDSSYSFLNGLLSAKNEVNETNYTMHDYNFFIAYLGGIIMLFILGLAVLNLIERIIDLVFLYIISPIIIAVSPLDDGNRLGIWKDLTIAKFTSIAGMLICFYIYFLFMSVMNSLLVGSTFLIKFTKLLCAIGGALAARKGGLLISNLVGHNTALIEGQQQGLAAQAVGTGFRAGLGVISTLAHSSIQLLRGGASGVIGALSSKLGGGNISGGESKAGSSAANGITSAAIGAAATTFNAVSQGYSQTHAPAGVTNSTSNNISMPDSAAPSVNAASPPIQSMVNSGQSMSQPPNSENGRAGTATTAPIGESKTVMPPVSSDIQSAINGANGFSNAQNSDKNGNKDSK